MIDLSGKSGPTWRRVLAHLRERITRGEFPERMPSEKTLSQEYGVAIGTVRKAMAQLRRDGVIRTDRGWGSYVISPPEE